MPSESRVREVVFGGLRGGGESWKLGSAGAGGANKKPNTDAVEKVVPYLTSSLLEIYLIKKKSKLELRRCRAT